MNAPGLPAFDDPAFRRLAAGLGPLLTAATGRSFQLVYESYEHPVTVWLHPHGRDAAVDVPVRDLTGIGGARRRTVVESLLMFNGMARGGPPLWAGLDGRGWALLHARMPMDRLDQGVMGVWLNWLLPQARRLQELVRVLNGEFKSGLPGAGAEGAGKAMG